MEKTVDAICQGCGKTFRIIPSRAKHGRGKSCSPACQYAAITRRPKKRVTLTCIGCGAAFTRMPAHAHDGSGKGKYCSRACRDKTRIRILHPQYKGGPECYRGPNWPAQKRKAKRRDGGICQHCGQQGTDVHHIRPFRLFVYYTEANALENLTTLCKSCHRSADALVQRVA